MPRWSASSKQPAPSKAPWLDQQKGTLDLGSLYPPLAKYWPNLGTASPQQAGYLLLDCLEALYGGAAFGGKSDALLAAASQYVDQSAYAALILRRTFAELSLPGAIMDRSKQWWLHDTDARWSQDEKTWTFPSGATITFGYLEKADDVYRYQGSEYQFIGFDELTQFEESVYTYLFSRVRRLKTSGIPLRIRSTSNPGGIGHGWVLKRFPIKPGRTPADCDGRVFIPAKVADNPGADPDEYGKTLENLPEVLRQQLLDGDWGVFEGAAFGSFHDDVHVVKPFPVPAAWERFECMDYGLNNPTAWYLVLTDYDGNLVFFDSLYRPGLPSEIAPLVLQYRQPARLGGRNWERRDEKGWGPRNLAYGDPAIQHRTGGLTRWGAPATIETEFLENGVDLIPANNDPRAGYARLRELVEPDPNRRFPAWHPRYGQTGSPRLFIVGDHCPELVDQFKAAPLQPSDKHHGGEMVDPKWEGSHGHGIAAARYGVLARPAPSKEPEPETTDPRAAFLKEVNRREAEPSRRDDRRRYQHV